MLLRILMLVLLGSFPVSAYADYFVVPVEGVIDGGLAAFVERSISEAEEADADGVIFRINTPGGRIDSAVEIKDTILAAGLTTVAFIDKSAISAGSLISIACDSIYMATGASIGAATAVDLQGKKASEKVISYFRAQMRATAEATGRPPEIAEAMVDEEIAVDGVTEAGKLVTLTYNEALELGISEGTLDSLDDVLAALGSADAPVIRARPNWAEYLVRFFTHPVVSSLLMSIGFLGLVVEMRTPGWGIGGTIALIALALFFGSHFIVRLAGVGELLVFAAGLVLLILEVFVIPGFGIAGIAGITMIVASFYMSLVGRMPMSADFVRAGYVLLGAVSAAILGAVAIIRFLPAMPFYDRITLATEETALNGFRSADNSPHIAGTTGIALTSLRPSGKAEIGGARIDVVTDGEFIERGAAIVVTEVRGARIVVTKADTESTDT